MNPSYLNYDEKVECINCGWEGYRDNMPDPDKCPECDCADYIEVIEEEEES